MGGRKRSVIQQIQEETATSIYLPSCFAGVFGHAEQLDLVAHQNTVYITGDSVNVQRAKDMLHQLSVLKSKALLSREMVILPRKLDWMLTDRLSTVTAIAHDNGTTVAFPVLGSQASALTVLGDNRVAVERTTRALMALAAQFYSASIWLLPMGYDVFAVQQALTLSQVAPALRLASIESGAEVLFKSNCFEVHGLEAEVRRAVSLLLDLELVRPFNYEVRFQIELANEHRDFISGKKNGKMNKIMKAANVRIKFETFNEYNFRIDVSSADKNSVLHGLALLQEELPAETSFHVPEVYHKRIIGVGGKNIQRIMKKYGVYVKFSNADEFASLGGYHDNADNVVARTPAKNAAALAHLRTAVMELVPPSERDWATSALPVPRRFHRTLLGDKSIFVHDIEARTGTTLCVPPREDAQDVILLVGPALQRPLAARLLLAHVPTSATFAVPATPALATALALAQAPASGALGEHPIDAMVAGSDADGTDVDGEQVPHRSSSPSPSSSSRAGSPGLGQASTGPADGGLATLLDEIRTQLAVNAVPPALDPGLLSRPAALFRLFTAAANVDKLIAAKDKLTRFLAEHDVPLYPDVDPTAAVPVNGGSVGTDLDTDLVPTTATVANTGFMDPALGEGDDSTSDALAAALGESVPGTIGDAGSLRRLQGSFGRTESLLSLGQSLASHAEPFASARDLALAPDTVPTRDSSPPQHSVDATSPLASLHTAAPLTPYALGSSGHTVYGVGTSYPAWATSSDVWAPPSGRTSSAAHTRAGTSDVWGGAPDASAPVWPNAPLGTGTDGWSGSVSPASVLRRSSHVGFYAADSPALYSARDLGAPPAAPDVGWPEMESATQSPRALGLRAQSLDFGSVLGLAPPASGPGLGVNPAAARLPPMGLYTRGNRANASLTSLASLPSLHSLPARPPGPSLYRPGTGTGTGTGNGTRTPWDAPRPPPGAPAWPPTSHLG